MDMLTRLLYFCLMIGTSCAFAEVQAYQIAGRFQTLDKEDIEKRTGPKGSTSLEVKTQVLEIELRQTNPTVGEIADVHWAVWIKDLHGQQRVITQGERELQVSVGMKVEFVSDEFELREKDFDLKGHRGNTLQDKVEGYAIWVLDAEGEIIGTKFQPGSLEADARKLMEGSAVTAADADPPEREGRKPPKRRRNREP